jgi:hypothetical protein
VAPRVHRLALVGDLSRQSQGPRPSRRRGRHCIAAVVVVAFGAVFLRRDARVGRRDGRAGTGRGEGCARGHSTADTCRRVRASLRLEICKEAQSLLVEVVAT